MTILKRMLKREVTELINDMDIDEEIHFQFHDHGLCYRLTRKEEDSYKIYSWDRGWSDQVAEDFDQKQTIKMIWTKKPHGYY